MRVYYRGLLNRMNHDSYLINQHSWLYNFINENCSKEERIHICQEFNRINDRKYCDFPAKIISETFIKKLNLLSFRKKVDEIKNELIFEKIKGTDGNYYAREIYTNKIFPLVDQNNITREYEFTNFKKLYASGYDITDYEVYIRALFTCNMNNMLKLDNFFYLPKCEIADTNMIEEYKNKKFISKKIFFKEKENKKLINKIIELSNKNVFKSIIEEIKEIEDIKERTKQDPMTSTMERIEFLLLKLDKVNHEIKINKQKKYEEMLNSLNDNLTTSPLNNETLKLFEAELEYAIKFNPKTEDDILNTLDNIINEYNYSDKTDKTIKDIDELVKLFLQMKSNYSIVTQRNAINKFALIYIYELYENKDNIKIEELNDSYINDMLISILICLNNMIDNNEIENNIIINLEENISLNYVINCINNIKFTKQKVLTKN